MTRTSRIVRFGSFTSDKIVRIQRGMSASPPTHRRAGHKDRCSVLTRLTPWPFAMKTPSQWTGGRNVDISRVPSSGRTLYIDPAAGKPTRPLHRRDTRQHRIDGGALFIVDCDPIPTAAKNARRHPDRVR